MANQQDDDRKKLWTLKNDVLAVIDDFEDAESLVNDLVSSGVDHEGIAIYSGDEAAEQLDADGKSADWLTRILRSWWHVMTDEGFAMEDYEKQVRAGRYLIAVHVEDGDEVRPVHEILVKHKAHNIRYFGNWAIEELRTR